MLARCTDTQHLFRQQCRLAPTALCHAHTDAACSLPQGAGAHAAVQMRMQLDLLQALAEAQLLLANVRTVHGCDHDTEDVAVIHRHVAVHPQAQAAAVMNMFICGVICS